MTVMRVFKNVSEMPLEICEVGKRIKDRVCVNPGDQSPPVKVSKEWADYITTQTGFALLLSEEEVQDDVPEGFVETTEVGDRNRKFRPMSREEREKAGLEPLVSVPATEPVAGQQPVSQRVPVRPKPTPAPAPAPVVEPKQ